MNPNIILGYLSVASKNPISSNLATPSQFRESFSSNINCIGSLLLMIISLSFISSSMSLSTASKSLGPSFFSDFPLNFSANSISSSVASGFLFKRTFSTFSKALNSRLPFLSLRNMATLDFGSVCLIQL